MDQENKEQNLQRFRACFEKQEAILQEFLPLSQEERYERLIEIGKRRTTLPRESFEGQSPVPGCQSEVFLRTRLNNNHRLVFDLNSDGLVARGMASLLLSIYEGEDPLAPLFVRPECFDRFLHQSLTPGRSNGLSQMYRFLQQQIFLLLKSTEVSNHDGHC